MAHAIEMEIERNYAVFVDMLDDLMKHDEGKYALLHDRKLQGIYLTAADAGRAGVQRYDRQLFSIQLVFKEPVDLGFYSYAAGER